MPKIEKWGLLPNTVLGILHKKEWENRRNLKQRLLNQRPFPIEISLKVPTDQQARDNLGHFHAFLKRGQILLILNWLNGKNGSIDNFQNNVFQ